MYLTGERTTINFTVCCVLSSEKLCLYIHCLKQVTACVVGLAGLLCDYLFTSFS